MKNIVPIVVAYGDGIGPEIMESTLKILKEADAGLDIQSIEIGKKIFDKDKKTTISAESLELIKSRKILLKSPTTTPQGDGFRSANVDIRKSLSLYANVRPAISYYPVVKTAHPKMDVVIIRENEEDLYSGIEYRQTNNVSEAIKIASKTGCEKIINFAFQYALRHNRKKICCFSKDNIMKITEGIMHRTFKRVSQKYGDQFLTKHYIVDIGTAILSTRPEEFDIVVTSNMFGDILSDITAELTGSVGMGGSANIGERCAMFEAVHGSAPDIAEKDLANPSGLINASIMMLRHIGKYKTADLIENALKKTLEDGFHTIDIYKDNISNHKVGTTDFTKAIIDRLGQKPQILKAANTYFPSDSKNYLLPKAFIPQEKKVLLGVDVYLDFKTSSVKELLNKLHSFKNNPEHYKLDAIFAKGLKMWPNLTQDLNENYDHWCCRFLFTKKEENNNSKILDILKILLDSDLEFIKLVKLFSFDGINGFY